MRKTLKLMMLLLVVMMSLVGCSSDPDIKTAISKEVIIYTTEFKESANFRNRTDSEIVKKLSWLLKREIILPVIIHVKAATRCKDITDMVVDHKTKTVTLTLPEPEFIIDGTRIDWENSEIDVGWLRSKFTADELEGFAQLALEECKGKLQKYKKDYINIANQNAVIALTSIIERFGYKAVINF